MACRLHAHAHITHDREPPTDGHAPDEDVRLPLVRLPHRGNEIAHERVLASLHWSFPQRPERAFYR